MTFRPPWKLDLKQLDQLRKSISEGAETGTRLLSQFSGQLTQYESRVRGIARGLDLKGRAARKRSEATLEEFLRQLKKTRGQVEKNVATLVKTERKKLHHKLSDLVKTLRHLAGQEAAKPKRKSKSKPRKKAAPTKTRITRKAPAAAVSH